MTEQKTQALHAIYERERARLSVLAASDAPQGEYASPVFGEGDPNAPVLLIGEAPGAEETKLSRPFVGKAGKQLDELIRLSSLGRDRLYITNVVKYRPVVRSARSIRNRTPDKAEIIASLPLLKMEIALLSPMVIVTLGNTPLKAIWLLTGQKPVVIGDVHGAPRHIAIEGRGHTLFAMYHPASGIYNRSLVPVMRQDAVSLGEHLVKWIESAQIPSDLCYTE